MQNDEPKHRIGNDGLGKLKRLGQSNRRGSNGRTFTLNIVPVTKAAPVGKGSSVDYLDRTGTYAKKHEDLVAAGGRKAEEMKDTLQRCHDETNRKNGRVAITLVQELPRELEKEGWIDIAEGLALQFEKLGYPVHWAIHNDQENHNPHVHLVLPARPIQDGVILPEGKKGQPSQFHRLFVGKGKVRAFRQKAAEITNDVLQNHGFEADWHGGNFRDVGVNRPAKVRVPQSVWHRKTTKFETVKTMIAVNNRIDLGTRQQILVQNNRDAWWAQEKARREELKAQKEQARLAVIEAAERPLKEAKQEGWEEGYMEANGLQSDRIEILEVEKEHLELNLTARTKEVQQLRKPVAPLSDKQISYLKDIHAKNDKPLPDLSTHEGRSKAFQLAREHEAMEAVHAKSDRERLVSTLEKERARIQQLEKQLQEAARSPQTRIRGSRVPEVSKPPKIAPERLKQLLQAWENHKPYTNVSRLMSLSIDQRKKAEANLNQIYTFADEHGIDLPGDKRQKRTTSLKTNHRGLHREL